VVEFFFLDSGCGEYQFAVFKNADWKPHHPILKARIGICAALEIKGLRQIVPPIILRIGFLLADL
jgi:hypothetical protein